VLELGEVEKVAFQRLSVRVDLLHLVLQLLKRRLTRTVVSCAVQKKVVEVARTCRVPELIPVLGSQPAGDVSHKPGGRLPLLSAGPSEGCYQFRCLVNRGMMGVNSLPKTVTRQRRSCDLIPVQHANHSATEPSLVLYILAQSSRNTLWYDDSVDSSVEENSSVFSLFASASEATATWRFTNFVLYCIIVLYCNPNALVAVSKGMREVKLALAKSSSS